MTIINEQEIVGNPQENESDIVLSVNGVSKKFCRHLKRSLFYGVQDITSELLGLREKNEKLRPKEFWALDNVSFQLRRGEALGLIGKNGSGKSTLLRIIAGLIKPDTGLVEVKGRVAPLIALGAGFNPILTGRENIYANMSILGLSKKEINERFDEVVDFAEIGDAIDAPVQSYSSGMAARLGFASAIHTEPDILLVDEVLAVGDMKFREKCHRKLSKLRQNQTSFILVSHSNHELSNVCESAVYLSQGKLVNSGSVFSVIEQYIKDTFVSNTTQYSQTTLKINQPQSENLNLKIISLYFKDSKGQVISSPLTGEEINFCVKCEVKEKIENVNLYIVITSESGNNIRLNISSFHDQYKLQILIPGEYEIRLELPCLVLNPGYYAMDIYVKEDSLYTHDLVDSFRFQVNGKIDLNQNLFYQPRIWTVIENKS
ncbi:ABC transporter ATP-binding protein [Nostoc sphaeroides CHAB 2801]|uniref:ABC transporter ATP-binding protein n=1 Tax=Nostoc sphaeroides TaxID=446679 RepID=UPI001E3450B5|nr:ABC transporter ATP-binding protein [Nostoc sphaeroides]MCC5632356.1 ABC transporter ATP-binding protein [Nostoc sphaeroides CHAB 2801]